MSSVITVKTLATSSRTVQTRSLHQEHHVTETECTPDHVTITTIGKDLSPLTTDVAKEDASTGQDHTTSPTVTKAQATIGRIHPVPHPTTAASQATHQLTDTLGDTLTGTHTPATHPRHATFPTRVTLRAILWIKTDLVQDTYTILPKTIHKEGIKTTSTNSNPS